MYYIQYRYNKELETIDQAETRKEARELLSEYLLAYRGIPCDLYISQRPCKEWKEEKQDKNAQS